MRKTFWTLVILFVFNFLCCKSPADPEIEKALEEAEELPEANIVMSVSPNPLGITYLQMKDGSYGKYLLMTILFMEHNGVSAEFYNFACEIKLIGKMPVSYPIDYGDGKLKALGSLEFYKRLYIFPAQDPCEVEIWGQFTDENGHDIEVAKTIRVEPYT